jgi:outer membrane biosynthesis protein TonB
MSVKKSAVKKPSLPPPEPEKQQPQENKPPEQPPEPHLNAPESTPQLEKPKPLTLVLLNQELQSLKHLVDDHSNLMVQLQEILTRKRKPVASNGKVQIKDKQTGTIYRSKNNAYQTLLKSGALKELVDKGAFGDVPEKNTFGWYTLVREWPDRFEEVKPEEPQQ